MGTIVERENDVSPEALGPRRAARLNPHGPSTTPIPRASGYTDTSGKRRLKTFSLKKHADAFAASTHIGVREGTQYPDSVSVTVARAAELWIAHCEAEGLERGTIKQRNEHLRLHIQPFISDTKLSALTAPRVQQWLDELRDAGRSLFMRQKVLANLKTMVSYAQSRGMVAERGARNSAPPEQA